MLKKIIIGLVYALLLVGFILTGKLFLDVQKNEKEALKQLKVKGIEVFLENTEISGLYVDGDILYVGGNEGVYKLDGQTGEILETVSDKLKLIYTAAIVKSPDDVLWIGHDSGISAFDGTHWKHFTAPDIVEGRCNAILADKQSVWAGFQGGAVRFEASEQGSAETYRPVMLYTKAEGLAENTVNAMDVDPYQNFWFGAYLCNEIGGLSIMHDENWSFHSLAEGLPHKYITSIEYVLTQKNHLEGALVGCGHLDRGGLALFTYNSEQEPILSKVFTIENGLPGEKVRFIYHDHDGNLWITSELDGILICDDEAPFINEALQGLLLDERHGLSDNEIKVIDENEKYYWLGGKLGLTRIEKSTLKDMTKQ